MNQEAWGLLVGGPRNRSLFDAVDESEGNRSCVNMVIKGPLIIEFEFTAAKIDCIGKYRDGKDFKHFVAKRHRRVLSNEKYKALRKLVPNPNKPQSWGTPSTTSMSCRGQGVSSKFWWRRRDALRKGSRSLR